MRAPRTLRTALVAAGVTAALGVSATGAFAHAAPATGTAASATHASGHCKTERVYVKTVELADKVSKAKVFKTGKHRYEAEIWGKGLKYGTMAAKGRTAHAEHNGLHIALQPNGKVTSWVERAKPKPKPVVKRVLVTSAPLADGTSTARIYKVTANHYEADIYADGTRFDTLVANGRAAYGQLNGLHVVLQPDGQLSSWVDRAPDPTATPTPTPKPDQTDTPTPATPTAVAPYDSTQPATA
ncbi:hypothetical protein GCM10022403_002580 [Streptomyces coacervatus]|uniref:Uncharacterized protein n=1 Tax=Streptomyces coacervatus TaxID=647381 RepID=A0ABP7GRV6_9ACTN|nr:hypothetical protein [Streptomyces coacervatus]MDF2264738.1 hypothetical protein [Streptomyces coacervatus]